MPATPPRRGRRTRRRLSSAAAAAGPAHSGTRAPAVPGIQSPGRSACRSATPRDPRGSGGLRENDAGGRRHAVADRARVIQLTALMDDVQLQRKGEDARRVASAAELRRRAVRGVGRVETLPLQPQVVLEPGAVKEPLQSRLVWAIEGEPLPLNRRKQSMRTGAIGTWRRAGARRVERWPEDEGRAPASYGQRQHRPHQLEGGDRCQSAGWRTRRQRAARRCRARFGLHRAQPCRRSSLPRRTGCGTRCCRRRRSRPRRPTAPAGRAPLGATSLRTPDNHQTCPAQHAPACAVE